MTVPCPTQDIHSLISEAEKTILIPNEKAAFEQYKIINKKYPENAMVLSKCSELCSRIGNREVSPKTRDAYYAAGIGFAKQALQTDPNYDEAHVAYAIAIGRVSLTKSGKEKITNVKEIKQHAEKALSINPNNFKAWHILGKWNYEVANLNFLEKAAVKVFYGGLPNASIIESIKAYDKARMINPDFILNYLELAKAYHKQNDDKKAISYLEHILKLNPKTEDDPRIKKEAMELIQRWR